MDKFLKFINKFCFLSPLPTILISIPCFAFVTLMLIIGEEGSVLSYISYIVSAYAMIITATLVYRVVIKIKADVKNHRLWKRYKSDIVLRAKISLYPSVLINVLYVVTNLCSGIIYHSYWFVTVSIYYALLVAMRFFMIGTVYRKEIGQNIQTELKKTRLCGILLLFMDLALALIVFFMVYWSRGYNYPGILIYVMAMYSFYSVTIAIVNLVKYRKYGSPVLMATKVISLTAALVSILSLETAMLSAFGMNESLELHRLMTALTGAGVCFLVLGMAIFMIVRSAKEMKIYAKSEEIQNG